MMRSFYQTCAAACIAAMPLGASAAAVDLAAAGFEATDTSWSIDADSVDVFNGALSTFNFTDFSTISASDASDVSSYVVSLAGMSDADNLLASGGSNPNFGPTPLEILFTDVMASGVYAAADGEAVLLSLDLNGLSFSDGIYGAASFSVTLLSPLAPIPLPAGSLLMLTGLGAFAVTRRKRHG